MLISVCVFYGFITMDGHLADKNNSLDWFYQTGTIEEFVKHMLRDKNIWIIGGNTILAPLLDNHVVII